MNLIKFACVLTYVCLVVATSPSKDEKCVEEIQSARLKANDCAESHMDMHEFSEEINNITLSDDLVNAQAFATKYCPLLTTGVKCYLKMNDISAECKTPKRTAEIDSFYTVQTTLLRFLCDNNAKNFIDIFPDNGMLAVRDNQSFIECLSILKKNQPYTDDEDLTVNPEFCKGYQSAKVCFTTHFDSQQNKNLARIASEMLEQTEIIYMC